MSNDTFKIPRRKILAPELLALAQSDIDRAGPGFYTARELSGASWPRSYPRSTYGILFKGSVDAGLLRRIRWVRRRSNRSNEYEILPRT